MASAADGHADTHGRTNRRSQMEAPATAGAHRHEGGINLPLEVAKETASGGGTHFALLFDDNRLVLE